jgi:hypothetical protein
MKRLISPPIQVLFWLGGLALLGLAAWGLLNLKLQVESQKHKAEEVSVKIPDSSLLNSPDASRYPQMVQAPLFWESRKALEPPKAEPQKQVVVPTDTALPEGRLIGIVDLGDKLFAVMQNAAGGGVHLKVGETWGAWKVTGIDPDKLILTLGDQRKELPLVGDFAAPKANPTNPAGNKTPQRPTPAQAKAVQPSAVPTQMQPPVQQAGGAAVSESAPTGAGAQNQPPPLSAQEALEARQRLMASRWGALTGDAQQTGQAAPAAGGQ